MKREIKFRAWDTVEEFMHPGFTFEDIIEIMASNYNTGEIGPMGAKMQITRGSLIWMQYTCLRDKNEVEIYEGDIVALDISDKDMFIGYVVYNKDLTLSNLGWGLMTKNGYMPLSIGIYRILGNIYENPNF